MIEKETQFVERRDPDVVLIRNSIEVPRSKRKIQEFFASQDIPRSENYCRGLARYFKQEFDRAYSEAIKILVNELPEEPTRADIARVAKRVNSPELKSVHPRYIYDDLKITHPDLWSDEPRVPVQARIRESDAMMLEAFSKMLGLSQTESMLLLLRGMILAATRNQINLIELAASAKKLKRKQVIEMTKFLSMNLRNL